MIVTPDTPLLLFGSLYLLWLTRLHERLADEGVEWWLWVLGGLLLGGGLLSKYTNVLLAVAGGISFLIRRALAAVGGRVRRLHAAVAAVVASRFSSTTCRPGFCVPLRFQWTALRRPTRPGWLPPLAEFLGGQVLLFGVVPLVVFVWALHRRSELCVDPRQRVCFCLFALPLGFFLLKACLGRVQANWAWGCYLRLGGRSLASGTGV